jgi:hypothetical protein
MHLIQVVLWGLDGGLFFAVEQLLRSHEKLSLNWVEETQDTGPLFDTVERLSPCYAILNREKIPVGSILITQLFERWPI